VQAPVSPCDRAGHHGEHGLGAVLDPHRRLVRRSLRGSQGAPRPLVPTAPAPPHASPSARQPHSTTPTHGTSRTAPHRTRRLPPHSTAPLQRNPRDNPHRTAFTPATVPAAALTATITSTTSTVTTTYHHHHHQHRHHQHRRHCRHTPARRRIAPHAQNKEAAIDGIVQATAKFRAVEVSLLHPPIQPLTRTLLHPLVPGGAATPTTANSHPRTATPPPCLRCRSWRIQTSRSSGCAPTPG